MNDSLKPKRMITQTQSERAQTAHLLWIEKKKTTALFSFTFASFLFYTEICLIIDWVPNDSMPSANGGLRDVILREWASWSLEDKKNWWNNWLNPLHLALPRQLGASCGLAFFTRYSTRTFFSLITQRWIAGYKKYPSRICRRKLIWKLVCDFMWWKMLIFVILPYYHFFSCPRRFIIIRVYERRRFSVTPRVVFHIDDMRFVSTSFFAFLRSSRLRRSPPFFSPCYCFFPLWDFFFCGIKLNQLPVTPNKCFRCFQVLEDLMIHAYKLRDTNRTTKWL